MLTFVIGLFCLKKKKICVKISYTQVPNQINKIN